MGKAVRGLALACLLVAPAGAAAQADASRLYGRVETRAGEALEGFLRWDRNEASWADFFHASRDVPASNFEGLDRRTVDTDAERRRARSIEFMGIRVSWDQDDDPPESAESAIRFGYLASVERVDEDRALLTLKSGERQEWSGSTTDLGQGLRGIRVETETDTVELDWDEFRRVTFLPTPSSPTRRRLHGTVVSRSGTAFTGFIAWDLDELFTDDRLDAGWGGDRISIPYDSVHTIRRARPGATVTRVDGTTVEVDRGRDIGSRVSGILVSDHDLGQVDLDWREVDSVRFHAPDRDVAYDAYQPGSSLRGTVVLRDGERLSGPLRWDNDERYGWEVLDGRADGIDFDVELSAVRSVRRLGTRRALVTLLDGRELELGGSNDIGLGNKGIVLLGDETPILIEWLDLDEVVFEW